MPHTCQVCADIVDPAGHPRQLCWHNQISPLGPVLRWAHLLYGSALSNGSWDTWLPSRHWLWHLWCSLGWVPWVSVERGPDASLRSRTASAKPRTSLFRLPDELPENQNNAFPWNFEMCFSQAHFLNRLKQMKISPLATALKNEITLRDMALPFSEQVLIKGWEREPQNKTGIPAHSRRQLQLCEASFTAEWRGQLL